MWLWPGNLGAVGFLDSSTLDSLSVLISGARRALVPTSDLCREVGGCVLTLEGGLDRQGVRQPFASLSRTPHDKVMGRGLDGSPACKCQAEILLQFLNATFRRVYCFPP